MFVVLKERFSFPTTQNPHLTDIICCCSAALVLHFQVELRL